MVSTLQSRTMRKAFFRLLPILILAYFAAFLDRVNIANAALTMNASIGLNTHTFGLGAGLFFISYFIFGPPSNLILERVGVRFWIAPMVILLGVLSSAMALIKGPTSFLVLRLLLGAAEAGFFPGVILYLTYWFPAAYRSRITAVFMMAIPASLAIAGPISNAFLKMSGIGGLAGWQWLFIMEGVPTAFLGVAMFYLLTDKPATANWLAEEEKTWLMATLASESKRIAAGRVMGIRRVLLDRSVLILSLIYVANITTNLGIAFFLPLIMKSLGATTQQSNYISAIPYLTGVVGIYIFGILSDHYSGKRKIILILALSLACVGLAGAGFVNTITGAHKLTSAYLSILMVSIAAIGIFGTKAPFWPLPSLFLTGSAAASGIAIINAIGNLGGFIGPYAVGWVKDTTQSYSWGLYALAAFGFLAVIGAIVLRIPSDGEPFYQTPIKVKMASVKST